MPAQAASRVLHDLRLGKASTFEATKQAALDAEGTEALEEMLWDQGISPAQRQEVVKIINDRTMAFTDAIMRAKRENNQVQLRHYESIVKFYGRYNPAMAQTGAGYR